MEKSNQEGLVSQAKEILRPEYHSSISVWLSNATKAEIKGLKIISIIYKNQGLKKFKPKTTKTLHEVPALNKGIFKVQSHYNEAFSENIQKKAFESEVLRFLKLSDLPISKTLKSETLMFIERWIELADDSHFQNLLLNFLRAFFSVCSVNHASPISTNHEDFNLKKIERNLTYNRKKFFNAEVQIKLPEIQRNKSQKIIPLKNNLTKDVKEIVNKDHKDLIKWVSGINSYKSMYQETFHGRSAQYIASPQKDFYTSTSIKLLPDLGSDKNNS